MSPLEVIGHRGYAARAPENTLAAVEAAIAAGADAVEWDVHVAACGTPVLIHDPDLRRTTDGAGRVAALPFAELARLDAGRWFDPAFSGERVPSLAEALALARGRLARVYTEVKGYRSREDLDRMLELVREAGIEGHVFISMDWDALAHLAARDPAAGIGYIVEHRRRFDEGLERATADPRALLDPDRRLILAEPDLARRALDRGIPLAVWTVNEPEEATRLLEAGVTRFTTDRVGHLIRWRESVA